jgi:hypothetical protein
MGTIGQGLDLWIQDNGIAIRALNEGGPQNQAGQAVVPDPVDEGLEGDEPDEEEEVNGGQARAALPPQEPPPLPEAWEGAPPAGLDDDCLSLYRLPPLPAYLLLNRHRILALGDQNLPQWQPGYDGFAEPVMQRLRYAFPERRISRADLVALFEAWHDPVLCLVATMVWGGIRHRGNGPNNHLAALLAMGEQNLRDRMEALRPLVRSGAFEKAFGDCTRPNRLKFSGVGYAFFTKIFYFLGQVPAVLHPAPLILDKWTSNAFLVLGRQACPSNKWREWFNTDPLCEGEPAKWNSAPGEYQYRLYVAWFNHWARELGTSAAQLEQFVFGRSRKDVEGRAWSNPRNQLIALGKTFFCPPPAP